MAPVVLECWARAVVVGGPAALATAGIGLQGSLGGLAALVVALGAALYLGIVWRVQLRHALREIVASAEPADGAREPRRRTIARALAHLAWVLPLLAAGVLLNVLAVALAVALGYAASEVLSANRLSAAEQRRDATLVRDGRLYRWLTAGGAAG